MGSHIHYHYCSFLYSSNFPFLVNESSFKLSPDISLTCPYQCMSTLLLTVPWSSCNFPVPHLKSPISPRKPIFTGQLYLDIKIQILHEPLGCHCFSVLSVGRIRKSFSLFFVIHFYFIFNCLIEVQLIYNVVPISAAQHSNSVIDILFFLISIMIYHRILNIVPCAMQ